MTGRVLTQPELCELPPSVLLLLPSSSSSSSLSPLSFALAPLSAPSSLVYSCTFPRRRARFFFPRRGVLRYTYPARVTHTRQIRTAMFLFSFSPFYFLFLSPLLPRRGAEGEGKLKEAERRGQRRRARVHDRAKSVHFQSTQTAFSRRLGQRRRRRRSGRALRSFVVFTGENADGKENDRGRRRALVHETWRVSATTGRRRVSTGTRETHRREISFRRMYGNERV